MSIQPGLPLHPINPKKPIIPTSPKHASVPLDPSVLTNAASPFEDFHSFKRRKELLHLRELEEIWSFLHCSSKGPILDVYMYLKDMVNDGTDVVKETAERMIDYLDSTRIYANNNNK